MTIPVIIISICITFVGYLLVTYFRSPIYKNRKQTKIAFRVLQREIQTNNDILRNCEKELSLASRNFLNAQFNQRLKSIPIEAIKNAGATNIRFSILHSAGYHSLFDLSGVNENKLYQIRGIGQKSSKKIVAAVTELSNRVHSQPPTLPKADLSEEYASELAEKAIKLVDANEALYEDNNIMKDMIAPTINKYEKYSADHSFITWVLKSVKSRNDWYAWSDKITNDFFEEINNLKSSKPFQNTRSKRSVLLHYDKLDKNDTLIRFHDRYADYSSVIEDIITRQVNLRGQKPREHGKIPREIADKVEGLVLDTKGLKVTLRQYQEFGAKYILAQERTILGDEMGLGKTIEALAAMNHLWGREKRRLYIVVSPAGITVNWEKEIQNRTDIPYYHLNGQVIESWLNSGGIAIVSYNTLNNLNLSKNIINRNKRIDMLVADEAHYIKNPAAQRTKSIASLLPLTKYACFMSGTPMENHPREFVRLIDMIRPGEGDQYLRYHILSDLNVKDAGQFHQIASSLYLRRNQEDVLSELPEKIEIPEWVDLSLADQEAYIQAVRKGNFMAMRRSVTIGGDHSSAKIKRLEELISEHQDSGRKVLVFSFFLEVLETVKKRVKTIGMISGALSSGERMELVKKFQESKEVQVLVSQIEAGGQGINLQSASVVIIMEPQFKPTIEAQAVARAHRMGQTKRVIVHRLLARNSVDERLVSILKKKEAMFEKYARESFVKDASRQAKDSTQIIKDIIKEEQQRLGIEYTSGENVI